jgi:hypothetical protein
MELFFILTSIVSLVFLIQAGNRYVMTSIDPRSIEHAKLRIIISFFTLSLSVVGWIVVYFFV